METSLFYQQATVWIVLIAIFLFALPRISHRFSMPGSLAIAISFPVVLGIYSVCGTGLHVTPQIAVLVAGIIFVLIISSILSDRPEMAIKHLILYSGAAFIGLAFANYDVFLIITIAAVIHSIFICTPLVNSKAGLLGNSNFAGSFLVPCVFIAFHINLPLAAFWLILVLFKTRCKGAFVALIVGSALVDIRLLLISVVLFSIFLLLPQSRRKGVQIYGTLIIRFNLWKSAFKLMTLKRFLFGMGGDVARILFMKDHTQYNRLRRIHSDIFQGLFDGGIFYVVLYLWIGLHSIFIAPPALSAALASLMIAGLFIDTQLLHVTSALFWVLIGQINFSVVPAVVVAPWILPIAIILLILAANTWGRAFIADAIHGIAFKSGNAKLMTIAHKINPSDDYATGSLIGAMILSNQNGPAFHNAWRLVDRYSGDLAPEIPYYLLALSSFNVRAYLIARAMAQQSLVYYPNHSGAKELLRRIDRLTLKKGKRGSV